MRKSPRFPATNPTCITRLSFVFAAALALVAASPAAEARPYSLQQLLDLARTNNPGLAAGAHATRKIEAQLSEANRSWLPTGELTSLVAPVPEVRCELPRDKITNEVDPRFVGLDPKEFCIGTNIHEPTTRLGGWFTRTELRLVQPLYTFGKISAGKDAAHHGVAASRSQQAGAAAELALNVRRAYYGIKLARAVLETFDEGTGYLDDAQKHVDQSLAKGDGTVTQTDKLRLKTVRADIDVRRLETEKLGAEAKAGLRALIGDNAPADLEVDEDELVALEVPDRSLTHYQEQARYNRPEVRALENLVKAKRSLAELEKNKQYPDLVLIGSAAYAKATTVDDPQHAFLNDPFNGSGFGLAAALRLPLDLGVRNARANQAAADADESDLRRREALTGINFEVARAFGAVDEAKKRHGAVRTGERAAKAWITAISQNLAAGLAETKDFQDALVAFFGFRVRVLQAAFDLNIAAATLSRATGIEVASPPPPPEAEPAEAPTPSAEAPPPASAPGPRASR